MQVFPSGPFSTNAYVVFSNQAKEAAIIDPALESFLKIENYLTQHGLEAKMILLTHSHWDHIADIHKFKEKYRLPVAVHSLDAPNLRHPGEDGLPCWFHIPDIEPDLLLEEGTTISLGDLRFRVMHTPGHSPGSVCFYEPQQKLLFSGDTLFQGTIGNLSFPSSQPSKMWASLDKLAQLPLETLVYPGHGPATTIKEEATLLKNAKNLFDH